MLGLAREGTLPSSHLTCNQSRLSLISLHFPTNVPPWPTLNPPFLTFDPSPGHLPSPGHTVSSRVPSTSSGTPHGAEGGESPLLVCGVVTTRELFLLFPTADRIPKEHQGTIWLCSTPKASHKNIGFNEREAQLKFNATHRKNKWSMLPQHISSVYF